MRWGAVWLALAVVGCFTDEPPAPPPGDGDTGGGDGCLAGELGCACLNGACVGTLLCNATTQVCEAPTCQPGTLACSCAEGSCSGLWVCEAGACVEPDPTTGADTTADADSGGSSGGASTGQAMPQVVLYYGWQAEGGDLRSPDPKQSIREHLQMRCEEGRADYGLEATCSETAAMILVDPAEQLHDLIPTDLPLVGPTSEPLAPSLAAALQAGGLQTTLAMAGVYDASETMQHTYWSGSDSQGSHDTGSNCQDWSSSEVNVLGATGLGTSTDGTDWFSTMTGGSCATPRWILCACW